ncbi:MAG TPA: helix-turn-helix domain-containing protein, partial [Chloroflexota bacterium]
GGPRDAGAADSPALCSSYIRALSILERRWVGLVLRVLLEGPHRFNEILAGVPGITDTLLTNRLRELEAVGLVERRVLTGSPVGVEYEVTEAGRALNGVMRAIAEWAETWLADTPPPC